MISKVLDGVCERLYESFGNEYQIYTEQVEQGFKEPCFFVSVISTKMTPQLCARQKGRYIFNTGVNIIFFPEQNDITRETLYSVGMNVVDIMEYISCEGDLIRGNNIICEFVGENGEMVASISCTYEFTVYKAKSDNALMETLNKEVR